MNTKFLLRSPEEMRDIVETDRKKILIMTSQKPLLNCVL
jgi:hypothetical protein